MEKISESESKVLNAHNYGLDYLRVFAMLAVVWVHLSIYLPISDGMRGLFTWGSNGVQVFFVLSGYLAFFANRKAGGGIAVL